MTLNKLRAVAHVSPDGWVATFHQGQGFVISKGDDPTTRLTAARRGGVRYIQTPDTVFNIMLNELQLDNFVVRAAPKE